MLWTLAMHYHLPLVILAQTSWSTVLVYGLMKNKNYLLLAKCLGPRLHIRAEEALSRSVSP